ncbi:hypothetical protein A2331_03835 [Candidatus Falkowbacteria bacterium RIFOXYB2_FULL_34_18]|uniref:Uncharacterized protein n=1 Tax=Candidatus Falkowbacteria bacterium RIFOXYD2_FULL_34_120 TaxID=1798007 RepID=A0A1F5TPC1_9BACT|nr:MAG: hypothetical protein A2331_03835 [Candidatus Falkowbacteria bacterium RIFOXYB2_FULL_34_18]OGF29083.1 MAG: hypothetical protein A2500_03160 [Candidatus Falkowbacteria bacterium RIFOXYC12_FULL_34_55]OGF36166.1 MAG: hypothetical protein A2466_04690 [Candidatus Falkowbacteria bacterium RIFOXYC2_FULL_34_220]OGF38593.1 MAG: hypothetical protein A2515_02050 [Candidatus Falkowbacteria bacterium RIFOXYD12_FULL_34_57]OGF40776.1 MAG: hypothetical protein A2531_06695 [Candidatus Falkowbacteria bact
MKHVNKILFLIILGIFILPQVGFCLTFCECEGATSEFVVSDCTECKNSCGGVDSVKKCVEGNTESGISGSGIPNPLNYGKAAPVSWQILVGRVIQGILGIIGSLALLMFVYGGFIWMMASGNNEAIQKGKNILMWATVGLVVIFSSYALVRLVFTGLGIA